MNPNLIINLIEEIKHDSTKIEETIKNDILNDLTNELDEKQKDLFTNINFSDVISENNISLFFENFPETSRVKVEKLVLLYDEKNKFIKSLDIILSHLKSLEYGWLPSTSFENELRFLHSQIIEINLYRNYNEKAELFKLFFHYLCLFFLRSTTEIHFYKKKLNSYSLPIEIDRVINKLYKSFDVREIKSEPQKVLILISRHEKTVDDRILFKTENIEQVKYYNLDNLDLTVKYTYQYCNKAEFIKEINDFNVILGAAHGLDRADIDNNSDSNFGFYFALDNEVPDKDRFITSEDLFEFKPSKKVKLISLLSCANKEFESLAKKGSFEYFVTSNHVDFEFSEIFIKSFLLSLSRNSDIESCFETALIGMLFKRIDYDNFRLYKNGNLLENF